jgi:hypothetical protein
MDNYWIALMVATVALAIMFGTAWQLRVRTFKRWLRALEAFADRELAHEKSERV